MTERPTPDVLTHTKALGDASYALEELQRQRDEAREVAREALDKWEELGKELAAEHDKLWVPEINGKRLAELRRLLEG